MLPSKKSKKDSKKQSKASKSMKFPIPVLIAAGVLVLVAGLGLLFAYFYKQKALEYMKEIDEQSYEVYTGIMENLLVLNPDDESQQEVKSNFQPLLESSVNLDSLGKKFYYVFANLFGFKKSAQDVVEANESLVSDYLYAYKEYFDELMALESEFIQLNNDLPSNSEDFEDRLKKFQDQKFAYENLLERVNETDLEYDMPKEIKESMVKSIEVLITQMEAICTSIETLMAIQDEYLAKYPPINGMPHPEYSVNYNAASKEERQNLEHLHGSAVSQTQRYSDAHSKTLYDYTTEFKKALEELNKKIAEVSDEVSVRSIPSFHTGVYVYSKSTESETQDEIIDIVLDVDEENNFTLVFSSNINQKEYGFEYTNTLEATGTLDSDTLSAEFETEITTETKTQFRGMSGPSRSASENTKVVIEYVYGRYLVTIAGERYELRAE